MAKEIYIGLMTGTSLDGIDTAICEINDADGNFIINELFFNTYSYPDKIRNIISEIISDTKLLNDISQLNFALSKLYANAVNSALETSGIEKSEITAIGMHGQTIWHQPKPKPFCGMAVASSFQIGNISALNQLTGIKVIGDFRAADVALGGQGAPLVPIFDYYFLRSKTQNNVALNIGGISNITYLPANGKKDDLIAFDTGPGNVLIDMAARKYFNINYDPEGSYARLGNTNYDILNDLMSLEYIIAPYPKSTGREIFNVMFFNKYFSNFENGYDALNTLSCYTALSITSNINRISNVDNLIISGGGAHNLFILDKIKENLPNLNVVKSDKLGFGIDSKEALCFAFLAYLNEHNLPGNIPSATGSTREAVLGIKTC